MCPVCHEPMVTFELEGIELDRCVACAGTWLDAGELETSIARAGLAQERLDLALRAAGTSQRAQRRCPRCRRKLRRVTLCGDKNGTVEIDRCPRGHGLWLDAGELRTVVTLFTDGRAGAVARFLAEMHEHALTSGKGD